MSTAIVLPVTAATRKGDAGLRFAVITVGDVTIHAYQRNDDAGPHEPVVVEIDTASLDRVWFTDVTQHRAADGWVCCCAVIDAHSRKVVGWSIADHMRSELVVDALEMARWQRRPAPGTVVHSDRGSTYTSWVFGHRLRQAGLLGSMGPSPPRSTTP